MPTALVRPTLAALAVLLLAGFAGACPFCAGGPGGVNEVRREVFGPGWWPNLLAAAAPFLVVGAVVAGVLRGPPPPDPTAGDDR